MNETLLWYESAADSFSSALPVGNGRIGGMVYGMPYNEVICINEDSVWSGGKRNRINPDSKEGLNEIRQLLEEDKINQAESTAYRKLQGISPVSRHYMPLANLNIDMNLSGVAKEYKRGLNLENAISFVEFKNNGVLYTREVFVSEPDSVMVVHLTAEEGTLDFCAYFSCIEDYYDDNRPVKENMLLLTGGFGGSDGIRFASVLTATVDEGTVYTEGNRLYVKDAMEACIIVGAKSSFYADEAFDDAAVMDVEYAAECSYDELRYRHQCDYKERYDKVTLNLNDNKGYTELIPTDERIMRMRGNDLDDKECDSHIHDNGLMTLYFNFARYLMISGSRAGTQPLNFQGIWNQDMNPYCGGRFELNVNTEMDYWIAESCNLSECHEPLFDLLDRVCENGRETAREMYGCNGFVAHTATDIWGDTAPQGEQVPSAIWCMGGAWLCLHIFDRYEYTLDKEFLKEKYPVMKEAAVFFTEYLREDGSGRLVVNPSLSPENSYKTESGAVGTLCKGASVDSQIISVLFSDVIKTTEILDTDHDFAKKLKQLLEKIPQPEVGKFGQIKEWTEEYSETDTGHKFVSQLFALHPAHIITPNKTPRLADAARATLIRRLIHGSGSAGISRAWVANMWARLYDSEMVYENIRKLIAYSTNPNMFDGQPRIRVDGNFGGASAMVEALMQSSSEEIILLPALPTEWQSGEIKGLCAKGGFEVSIKWQDGKLLSAEIIPSSDRKCTVRVNTIISVSCNGKNVNSTHSEGTVTFDAEKGHVYTIRS
ncbi:MAG: glycoside hydrolase family 95 protein [Oscillospiraceae bacterium]|nr:glycoside hydrolase family 95 protein [Oscillospiraceae bacterium]